MLTGLKSVLAGLEEYNARPCTTQVQSTDPGISAVTLIARAGLVFTCIGCIDIQCLYQCVVCKVKVNSKSQGTNTCILGSFFSHIDGD